jgi:hypothetical protein
MNQLVPISPSAVPALVTTAGDRASLRFLEFFAANIRNPHTRRAYYRAADEFLTWCANASAPSIAAVQPVHVATWIEASMRELAASSSGSRRCVTCSIGWSTAKSCRSTRRTRCAGPGTWWRRTNPGALSGRGALLDSLDTGNVAGLRDREAEQAVSYSISGVLIDWARGISRIARSRSPHASIAALLRAVFVAV